MTMRRCTVNSDGAGRFATLLSDAGNAFCQKYSTEAWSISGVVTPSGLSVVVKIDGVPVRSRPSDLMPHTADDILAKLEDIRSSVIARSGVISPDRPD